MNIRRPLKHAPSSLILLFIFLSSPTTMGQVEYGGVQGKILVSGEVKPAKAFEVLRDADVCCPDNQLPLDPSLQVASNGALRHAYIALQLKRSQEITIHPDFERLKKKPVVVCIRDCRFQPFALAVWTQQKLQFKNDDPIGHNPNIVSFRHNFCLNIPGNNAVDSKFNHLQGERTPSTMGCDIHPHSKGTILISEHPYFAITDETGAFAIEKIPAGIWTFYFWHNRCGYMKEMTQDGKTFLGKRGEFELEIKADQTIDLGKLIIRAEHLTEN